MLLSYIVYALLHSFVHLILFNPSHCKNRKRQKFPDIPQGFVFFAVSHFSDMLSAKTNTYLKTNGLPPYFVELSVITSLWKTDFIHNASFTPGLQQIDWHKTADGKSIWTRCAFLDGVTTSSNKILAFNTAHALTTFRSSIHSKILTWCVVVPCKPHWSPIATFISDKRTTFASTRSRRPSPNETIVFQPEKILYSSIDNVSSIN